MEYDYDFVFLYTPHFYDVNPDAQLGLGLLSLATYADNLGASVKVVNCQSVKTMGAVYRAMYSCKNLMMYGCLIDAPILSTIAANMKIQKRCQYVYVGGPIAKSPDKIDRTYIDVLVDGPGETFIELLVFNKGMLKITGHDFLEATAVYRSLEKDINYYPFPDRTLLEGEYGGNIFKRKSTECDVSTTILTSRGCKFHCAFCMSGNDSFYCDYDLQRIEKELEHCLKLGIKNFRISDDNLIKNHCNNERLFGLCKLFKEANIKWRASVRASLYYSNTYGEDIFVEMVNSGCEELSFGIESGDDHVLTVLKKGNDYNTNLNAVRHAKKSGVPLVRALMMMGTPGETFSTLDKNKEWVERSRIDMVSLKMFVPYPGTDIYDHPEKYGCSLQVKDVNNSAYRPDGSEAQANIDLDHMNSVELTQQFHKMKEWLESKGLENKG